MEVQVAQSCINALLFDYSSSEFVILLSSILAVSWGHGHGQQPASGHLRW